jgi:superfamily I DNA/RNA helicase
MAFNRPIADEMTKKLRTAGLDWKEALSNTVHGFGLSGLKRLFPNAKWNRKDGGPDVDESKVNNLLRDEMKKDGQFGVEVAPYASMIVKMIGMAKQRALGVLGSIDDHSAWFSIINDFQMDDELVEGADDLEYAVNVAIAYYKKSLDLCKTTSIDYSDMILAPLYFKARFWLYDWVMIDESQDTNPARRALARAILKPGGRLVSVGDKFQAIYGFTGADFDAMDLIKKEFDCAELGLSMTWRCPVKAVQRAQRLVPGIQARPDASEGSERVVYYSPRDEKEASVWDENFGSEDVVLSHGQFFL